MMKKIGAWLAGVLIFCCSAAIVGCGEPNPVAKAGADKIISLSLDGAVSQTVRVFDYIDENGAAGIRYGAAAAEGCVTVSDVSAAGEFTVTAIAKGETVVTIQAMRGPEALLSVGLTVTVSGEPGEEPPHLPSLIEGGQTSFTLDLYQSGSGRGERQISIRDYIDENGAEEVIYSVEKIGEAVDVSQLSGKQFTVTAIKAGSSAARLSALVGTEVTVSLDFGFTVIDSTPRAAVTGIVPSAAGYTMSGDSRVDIGSDYRFSVVLKQGYTGVPSVPYTVGGKAGAALNPAESPAGTFTFTVPSVSGDIALGAVTGIYARYGVDLSVGENAAGFTLRGEPGVTAGTKYDFIVERAPGYTGTPVMTYSVGGKQGKALVPAEDPEGTFTFSIKASDVTGEIRIESVTGFVRVYTVDGISDGPGYRVDGQGYVLQGDPYTFTVLRKYGYSGIPAVSMTVGGKKVAVPEAEQTAEGVFGYTVPAAAVTGDLVIGNIGGLKADVTHESNTPALDTDFFDPANWADNPSNGGGTVLRQSGGLAFGASANKLTVTDLPSALVRNHSGNAWPAVGNGEIGPYQFTFILKAEGNFSLGFLSNGLATPNELRLIYDGEKLTLGRSVGGAGALFGSASGSATGFETGKEFRLDLVVSAVRKKAAGNGLADLDPGEAESGLLKIQVWIDGQKIVFLDGNGASTGSNTAIAGHHFRLENGDTYVQRLNLPGSTSRYGDRFVVRTESGALSVLPVAPADILLKEAFKHLFPVGMTVQTGNLAKYTDAGLTKHFNSLTAEYQMKWSNMQTSEGNFSFTASDTLVNYAKNNGMKVRGHALVWYKSIPSWIFADIPAVPGSAAKTKLTGRIRSHVETVVKRFDDTVYVWDVVNEALLNSPSASQVSSGSFYRTGANETTDIGGYDWYKYCGTDYIDEAFFAADRARTAKGLSELKLFYNDYNLIFENKRNAAVKMLQGMLDRDVPVDGIGMQCHLRWDSFDATEFEKSVKAFTDLGIDVQLTEIDISLYSASESGKLSLTAQELAHRSVIQQKAFENIFRIARKYAVPQSPGGGQVTGVTFWGVADDQSWLNDGGRTDYPLLFDRNFVKKPAFDKIVNF